MQVVLWLLGLALIALLIWAPTIGIHALWNVLIPAAPALLVFAPGLWRNICPLASSALLPRHLGLSRRRAVSPRLSARLHLAAVVLLLLLVPLRHVIMDTSGLASALALLGLGAVALVMGSVYEWKSAWCSGLCPVHPVESLYGSRPAWGPKNAHCHACARCVETCPDSTPEQHLGSSDDDVPHRWRHDLMVGGFAGFIWGWFQVPDYHGSEGWSHLASIYAWPLGGMLVSFALYLVLWHGFGMASPLRRNGRRLSHLDRVFAAAAVSMYYIYRVPGLVGLGVYPGDGQLVDLSASIPAYASWLWPPAITALFLWWMVLRQPTTRSSWAQRPPFENEPPTPA